MPSSLNLLTFLPVISLIWASIVGLVFLFIVFGRYAFGPPKRKRRQPSFLTRYFTINLTFGLILVKLAINTAEIIPIIIPAHNSGLRIRDTLSNLSRQLYPDKTVPYVAVCANACQDNTCQQAQLGLDLIQKRIPDSTGTLIVTDQPGEVPALNTLLRHLDSVDGCPDWVIALNDDVFPTLKAVNGVWTCLQSAENFAVGVRSFPLPIYRGKKHGTFAGRVAHFIGMGEARVPNIIGRMCGFRRDLTPLPEDIISADLYITQQAANLGRYSILPQDYRVYHRVPTTFKDLFNQQLIYNLGYYQFVDHYGQTHYCSDTPPSSTAIKEMVLRHLNYPVNYLVVKSLGILIQHLANKSAQILYKTDRMPISGCQRRRITPKA